MPTKAKKKKTAVKKVSAAPLQSKPLATFAAFKALPGNDLFKNNPFKTDFFKMEMNMFKAPKQFEKITQDAAAIGQDQMDAVMKSTTIFAKGMEDIMKTCMEIAQEAGEKSANATKTMMSCKTLNEFTEAQTKLAQTSFDQFMTNATKISEMSVKVCTDCMAPINDQMGKAIKKASDTMAA